MSLFKSIIENCNDFIYLQSPQGIITYVAPNVEELLGFRADQLVGAAFVSLLHDDDVAECLAFQERLVVTGAKQSGLEYRIRHKNGEWRWFATNASLLTDETSVETLLLGIGRDITHVKQQQSELQVSEENYRVLLDDSSDPIFSFTREGRYKYVNASFARNIGKPVDAFIGNTLWDIFPAEEADKRFTALSKTFRTGEIESLEVCIPTATGELYFLTTITPVKDAAGEVTSAICSTKNVTKLKLTEKALLEMTGALEEQKAALQLSNETLEQRVCERTATLNYRTSLLETLLESSINGILMIDTEGKIILHNSRFIDMWQLPLELHAPQNVSLLLPAMVARVYNPEEFTRKMLELNEHVDQVSKDELTLLDGSTFDFYSSPLINSDGNCFGRAWFFRDISDYRQLQQQLQQSQKLEAIGRLAGGIAHDFNNKLSVIMGYALLASDYVEIESAETIRGYLKEISRAAELSRDITMQLLAFSRQQIVTPNKINPNRLINEMQRSLGRLIGEDIQLLFIPGSEVQSIYMDPVQIDQIFMNLAVNAHDAMPGGGTLTIETSHYNIDDEQAARTGRNAGEYVLITISDTGCGMDEDTLAHMFEPFFTTKEVGKGTGLGLATIHGIVTQNNGYVDVLSAPGNGTTIKLLFPGYPDAEQVKHAEHTTAVQLRAAILLVEDDSTVREVTMKLLQRAGYDVTACASPYRAIQLYEQGDAAFDLILTDVIMPGMNGWQMAEQIKALDGGVKLIFMSGYSQDVINQKVHDSEQITLIQKPVNLDELNGNIAELLAKNTDCLPGTE